MKKETRILNVELRTPENEDEKMIVEFQRNRASFGVVLGNAEIVPYGNRLAPCENRRAGIAFLFGVAPKLFITGQIQLDLTFLKLGFLQTEKVGIYLLKKI